MIIWKSKRNIFILLHGSIVYEIILYHKTCYTKPYPTDARTPHTLKKAIKWNVESEEKLTQPVYVL